MENEFLTIKEVTKMLKVSRMHFYRMRKSNEFAKPVMKSPLRWRASDIDNYMSNQTA